MVWTMLDLWYILRAHGDQVMKRLDLCLVIWSLRGCSGWGVYASGQHTHAGEQHVVGSTVCGYEGRFLEEVESSLMVSSSGPN